MKVVQTLPAMEGGGVEQGVLEVGQALVAAGHESVVVSAGGRLVERLEQAGSRHVRWELGRKSPATLLRVPAFRRWLASERPDIVHARSRLPAWVTWGAWRAMPVDARPRFVTTVHGLYSPNAYSAVMTRGERVIAVSDAARAYVLENYPQTDPANILRIHRGVDKSRFPRGFRPSGDWLARWREAYPGLAGTALVTLPGRLTRLKGHHDFIDMLDATRAKHPDVVGLVVGGGDAKRQRYEAELRRRGGPVVFTGHRSDLREIMAVSAAVVSLSTHPESFGRAVLEALSLGTPVVGYAHGGVGEVLSRVFPPGRAGPGDSADSARALCRILDDQAAARAAVRDHDFTLERMCAETLALYEELVRERARKLHAAPSTSAPERVAPQPSTRRGV